MTNIQNVINYFFLFSMIKKMKTLIGDLLLDANGVKENPVVLIEGKKIEKVGTSSDLKLPSDIGDRCYWFKSYSRIN